MKHQHNHKPKSSKGKRKETTLSGSGRISPPCSPNLADKFAPFLRMGLPPLPGELEFSSFGLDLESLEAEARKMLGQLPPRYLSELRRVKINELEIFLHLSFIWQTSRVRAKSLTTVPEVPIEAIRKLPKLLRKAAKQVDSINQHGVMRRLFFRRSWERIPGSLLSFAMTLQETLKAQKNLPRKPPKPDTAAKVRFVQYVLETSTDRKQHYGAIAALINAFNQIQDETVPQESRRVTAASLKILWLKNEPLRKTSRLITSPADSHGLDLFGTISLPGVSGLRGSS